MDHTAAVDRSLPSWAEHETSGELGLLVSQSAAELEAMPKQVGFSICSWTNSRGTMTFPWTCFGNEMKTVRTQ